MAVHGTPEASDILGDEYGEGKSTANYEENAEH